MIYRAGGSPGHTALLPICLAWPPSITGQIQQQHQQHQQQQQQQRCEDSPRHTALLTIFLAWPSFITFCFSQRSSSSPFYWKGLTFVLNTLCILTDQHPGQLPVSCWFWVKCKKVLIRNICWLPAPGLGMCVTRRCD